MLVARYQKFLEKSRGKEAVLLLLEQFEEAMANVLTSLDERGVRQLLSVQEMNEAALPLDLTEFKTALLALGREGFTLEFESDLDALRFIVALAYSRDNKRAR